MALNSSDVNAGDDILAAHHNSLIDDIEQHAHEGTDTTKVKAQNLDVSTGNVPTGGVGEASIEAIAVTKGKVKTGTGSATNITGVGNQNVAMQDYCFFPNIHCDTSPVVALHGHVFGDDDYVGRFSLFGPTQPHDAYWRYISASGPPEIWIVEDKATNLHAIWECDDPAPGGKPPIECFDKDGNRIGKTYRIIPPGNYAELKAQCQKDMAEKKLGTKPIGKILLEEWEIDEDSNPERPVGLDPAILVKKLKKIGS